MEIRENETLGEPSDKESVDVQRNKELFEYEMTEVRRMLEGRFARMQEEQLRKTAEEKKLPTDIPVKKLSADVAGTKASPAAADTVTVDPVTGRRLTVGSIGAPEPVRPEVKTAVGEAKDYTGVQIAGTAPVRPEVKTAVGEAKDYTGVQIAGTAPVRPEVKAAVGEAKHYTDVKIDAAAPVRPEVKTAVGEAKKYTGVKIAGTAPVRPEVKTAVGEAKDYTDVKIAGTAPVRPELKTAVGEAKDYTGVKIGAAAPVRPEVKTAVGEAKDYTGVQIAGETESPVLTAAPITGRRLSGLEGTAKPDTAGIRKTPIPAAPDVTGIVEILQGLPREAVPRGLTYEEICSRFDIPDRTEDVLSALTDIVGAFRSGQEQ